MEFWEYMDKVGMMHVGQGRKHPLHIEYVHMGVLLGFVQDVIVEAILSHQSLDLVVKTRMVKAIGKVLWIQNGGYEHRRPASREFVVFDPWGADLVH